MEVESAGLTFGSYFESLVPNWNEYIPNDLTFTVSAQNSTTDSSSFLCADINGWTPFVNYRISRCFFRGIVLQVPTVLAFTLLSFALFQMRKKQLVYTPNPMNQTRRFAVQSLATFALAGLLIYESIVGHRNFSFAEIGVLGPIFTLLSLLPALLLSYVELYKTTKPSAALLLYWLSFAVVRGLSLTSIAPPLKHLFKVEVLLAALPAFIFVVEWLQPRRERRDDRFLNPYDQADVFSRLSFSWLTPLMRQGYEHFLTNDDLPELASSDRADNCNERFEQNWQDQLTKKPQDPSVFVAILKSYGLKFAFGGLFKMIQDAMAFVQPQLLKYLILFVAEYREKDGDLPLTRGLYIALAMFLVSALQTLMLHQYFERAFGTGMNIRTGITNAIFRKSLVLSSEARATRTTGDTVNLMSIDTQRLQDVCSNGNMIWSGPFQITLCLVSLYKLMGPTMWVGVFILLILIPINSYLAQIQKGLQQRQMKDKDTRTRLTSELLSSIKSIKLYSWEDAFVSRLENVRDNHELVGLKKLGIFMACMSYVFNMTPFIVSCSTFACYVFIAKQNLTTEIVFPALMLFNMLGFPMAVFPMLISSLIEARVAVGRITTYLIGEELQTDAVERVPRAENIGDESVVVKDASFVYLRKYAESGPYALKDANFVARKGDLNCVVGRVGSGKTSLLMSILGNIQKTKGSVKVAGSIGYVAQNPWIFNGSVRENILFGLKYDEELYSETIAACALKDDLAILPDGDATVVGEKGLSLSGGQKARLSLARAVYARADVYLLDDPLSAVDEHVGQHIIANVLSKQGLLASKTVILATNSIPVLQHADHLAMIVNGEIVEQGTPNEKTPRINALLKEFGRKKNDEGEDKQSAESEELKKQNIEHVDQQLDKGDSAVAPASNSSTASTASTDESPRAFISSSSSERKVSRRGSTRRPSAASMSKWAKPLEVRGEHVEKGKVAWSVYMEYAKACGWNRVVLFWGMIIVSTAFSVGSNVWLKYWAESNSDNGYNKGVVFFIVIYAILGSISSSLQVLQALVAYTYLNLRAARLLHDKMLAAVVRAPMSFFETTPLGRIVNRFSSDVYRVDQQLIRVFFMLFNNCVKVFFTILIICYSTPLFLAIALPLAYFYLYYQRYYLRTSRELKRLDSVSKSPIFAQFQETLDGIATVRAFDATERFNYTNRGYIDTNNRAYFPSISANRWLAVRLEFLGSLVIFAASGLSVLALPSGRISAGVIGLALSYALQTTQSLNWIVRMTVDVETNIVSVERMMEYSSLPSEAAPIVEDHRPKSDWPETGALQMVDYSTRYRPELPLVLKNIELSVKAGEKIGIVGRTGAGKSSLTLALFRLIEPSSGHITIDNVNTSEIGLKDLRSHLSIIPQDSQLFEGTIRENLDPVGHFTDEQLWHSLELSHLKEYVSNQEGGLDAKVAESGSNLSSGQRQLLSLARALLTDSKILVLDEATAAVDVETDKLVQQVIRKEFKDRTILTIAHRLNTILDSDKVIVLDFGKVIEFDAPSTLMQDPSTMFSALCRRGGIL